MSIKITPHVPLCKLSHRALYSITKPRKKSFGQFSGKQRIDAPCVAQ